MTAALLQLVLFFLAPWLYLATGCILDAVRPEQRAAEPATIPLRGIVFWGVGGMASVMTGASPGVIEAVALLVLAVLAVTRRPALADTWAAWRSCSQTWWFGYVFFLVVLIVAPFPGMWLMGGDWLSHFYMAAAIHDGTFGTHPDHLARSPLFAAAAMPLLDFGSRLGAFQVFNAAAAAAAWHPVVQPTLNVAPADRRVRLAAWVALALSPFATVVPTNLWPKFFAGGCVVVAFHRVTRARERGTAADLLLGGVWLAFAILAHESSILFVFPWLALALLPRTNERGARWPQVLAALAAAGTIVAAWEVWTLLRFGWEARFSANPAVRFALAVPLWRKALFVLGATFWGTPPGDLVAFWSKAEPGFAAKGYYTLVAMVSWLGATVVGIAGGWVVALGAEWRRLAGERLRSHASRWLVVAVSLTIVAHAFLLGGIGNRFGAVQNGLVPLVMWVAGCALSRLTARDERGVRRALAGWWLLGWLPYCAAALAAGTILNWRDAFPTQTASLVRSDNDLFTLLHLRFEPLGFNRVWWLAAAAAAVALAVAVLIWLWRGSAPERERTA